MYAMLCYVQRWSFLLRGRGCGAEFGGVKRTSYHIITYSFSGKWVGNGMGQGFGIGFHLCYALQLGSNSVGSAER